MAALKADFGFGFAAELAVAPDGNLVFADSAANKILMVPVTSGTFFGQKMTAEHVYFIAGSGAIEASGVGGLATQTGMTVTGVAVDSSGNVLISDIELDRVWAVPPATGTFYGQPMRAEHIYVVVQSVSPGGLAVDSAGNILLAGDIRTAQIAVVKSGTYYGQPMLAGNTYTIAGEGPGGGADGLGDGGPAAGALLTFPVVGIAVGPDGDLYIDELTASRIRRVTR